MAMMRSATRVGFTIVLSVVAVAVATTHKLGVLPWYDGRRNGILPALELDGALAIIWLVCIVTILGIWLPAIVRSRERRVWLLVLALAGSTAPWFAVSSRDATSAFASGFNEWAMRSVDATEIRSLANRNTPTTLVEVPAWWPVIDAQSEWKRTVSRSHWTTELRSLSPDEVRINDDGALVLGWKPETTLGWARFVCLGDAGSPVPISLRNHLVEWRALGSHGWTGVRVHH